MSTSKKEKKEKLVSKHVEDRSTVIVIACVCALVALNLIDAYFGKDYDVPEIINIALLGVIAGEKLAQSVRK